MKKNTEDMSKLPKWAQSKIQVLEINLKCANDKLAGSEKTLQYGEPGLGYDIGIMTRRNLPHDRISWVNMDGVRFNISLTEDGYLEINISGYSGSHPVVFPRSSNHLWVGICPDKK